ncbi:hypothetical protein FA95DRAFT_1505744, partial [Auriscalpium vulgare]
INQFTRLADDSDEVPLLKKKMYYDYRLTAKDWEKLELMRNVLRMAPHIDAGLANLVKWYRSTDESDAYFIALVLDPNVKTAYAELHWDEEFYEIAMDQLRVVVCLFLL